MRIYRSATPSKPLSSILRGSGSSTLTYKGLETGVRKVASHVGRNHEGATFAFSSIYNKDSSEEINNHLITHGDGIKDIALNVENCKAVYKHSIANGGISVSPPTELSD